MADLVQCPRCLGGALRKYTPFCSLCRNGEAVLPELAAEYILVGLEDPDPFGAAQTRWLNERAQKEVVGG